MTDRFVPDKPGLYWINVKGDLEILDVAEIRDDNFRVRFQYWQKLTSYDWIAPVPDPDVVADLVAALEWYKDHAEDAIGFAGGVDLFALYVDNGGRARAALKRYREG